MCVGTNVCGTNVGGHKRLWAQACVGTNVSGHKRVRAQSSGHMNVWAQTCYLRLKALLVKTVS